MKTNFDKVIDRSLNNERRWSKEYITSTKNIKNINLLIDSSIADLDFEVPECIQKAIMKRASKGSYSYTFIRNDVLTSIKNWYKNYHDIIIDINNIKLVHGTVNAMHQIILAFTNKNDNVMIQTPIYEPFGRCISNNDRNIIENKLIYKYNSYFMNIELMEKQIIENNIKMFMWCSPHNPGGRVWKKHEVLEMVKILEKHNVLLISDEVHSDLIFDGVPFFSIIESNMKDDNYIICASPNKAFNLGGLKGSYLIIKNKNIRKLVDNIYEKNSITSPNIFYPEALKCAYESIESTEWLIKLKDYIYMNWIYVKNELYKIPNIEVMNMESSYLVWIKFDLNIYDIVQIKQKFYDDGILVNWEYDFYGAVPGWFRINIGSPKKIIRELIKRIKNIFKK